ncbi:tripartite motif-containing protein 45-like [Hydractinia symbiolongicarpus]|uniref:tripartite motif-containing protein 45-like n=1 Tax=Hydractinia symbiolongicarpus TaxID=13093 RepID=UPI00254FDC1E|nr:tripartite motif-containing protein 45-like [Hydractinia symbiolongicarpus]
MALSIPTITQLSTILECKICLGIYHNPKLLNCGHTYCQDCLDGILVFQDDGNAEMPCPLRCPKKTKLDQHETTSSLITNYPLVDMLGAVSNAEQGNYLCQSINHDKQSISYSCTTCSAKICGKCQIIHSCANKSYINVIFNQKLQEIQPLCTQHKSLAIEACIDCDNALVCVYCTYRDHKNHRRKKIVEFGEEAKQWFQSFITSFEETKASMENLTIKYDEALKNLKSSREIFVCELEVRKLKKMEEYRKLLNTESKCLLQTFDERSADFRKKIISAGLVDNTKIKEFSEYVKVFNSKSSFELVSEKLEIEKKLSCISSFHLTVPNFYSHLCQMSDKEFSANPLGELDISVDNISTDGANPSECTVFTCLVDKTDTHANHSRLVNNSTSLEKSLKGQGCSSGDGNYDLEAQQNKDLSECNDSSFDEIFECIEIGDFEKFKSIFFNIKHFLNHGFITNFLGSLLSFAAVHYNKPSILKCLIDAGCGVNLADTHNRNVKYYSKCCDYNNPLEVFSTVKDIMNHFEKKADHTIACSPTLLHNAAGFGHVDCLKILLSVPHFNVNIRNCAGETPLHFASIAGEVENVTLLLSVSQIDVNIQNFAGETPLHFASIVGETECVKLLLSVPHIDVIKRNKNNKTAYDVAFNTTIKRLLKEHQGE